MTVAAVALTAGAQVVVAVGRQPPEKEKKPSRFQSKLEFGAGLPSVDKRARPLRRLGVVGRNDVQLTRDVDLQERRGVVLLALKQ